MKYEDIDLSLIAFAEEEYFDPATKDSPLMPHEEAILERRRRVEDIFSMELLPNEIEMFRRRNRVDALFSQPRTQKVQPPNTIEARNPNIKPKKEDGDLDDKKKSRNLVILKNEQAQPPVVSEPNTINLNIDTSPRQFTLRGPTRRPRTLRVAATYLVAGCTLVAAAFAFPPTLRMIFNLIAGEQEKAEPPLIPASNSPEAKRLRSRIDALRITAGAFSDCYRLQANDNRVIWYFDNLGLIASCQTNPTWVRLSGPLSEQCRSAHRFHTGCPGYYYGDSTAF